MISQPNALLRGSVAKHGHLKNGQKSLKDGIFKKKIILKNFFS
jgi:hypothetical protein